MDARTYKATLLHVENGNTLTVMVDVGFGVHISVRCRLSGVEIPDELSPDPVVRGIARRARLLLDRATSGHPLWVTPEEHREGHHFAQITVDRQTETLNTRLARELAAWTAEVAQEGHQQPTGQPQPPDPGPRGPPSS